MVCSGLLRGIQNDSAYKHNIFQKEIALKLIMNLVKHDHVLPLINLRQCIKSLLQTFVTLHRFSMLKLQTAFILDYFCAKGTGYSH